MNRTLLVLWVAPLLAACASPPYAPVASPYVPVSSAESVVASNPDSISIRWSPWMLSEQVVRGHALLYCNGRPMEEVAAQSSNAGLGRTKTWHCLGT